MKRKLAWSAVVLAVLAMGVPWLLKPGDPVNPATWQRIRIGMTPEQVERILGRPGMSEEDYEKSIDRFGLNIVYDGKLEEGDYDTPPGGLPSNRVRIWQGRSCMIAVDFDDDGHVMFKVLNNWRLAEPDLLDKLRLWLGW